MANALKAWCFRLIPNAARAYLYAYLAAVIAVTFVHSIVILALALVLVFIAAGKYRWHISKRALWAILLFNLTVSLGYCVISLLQGNFVAEYLLRVNLRVYLMVFLGFWFISRVDLLGALQGWPLATLLASLCIGQIKVFERLLRDYQWAFTSRNIGSPTFIDRSRHTASQVQSLLDKSYANSLELSQAMRSRGAFDD